MNKLLNALKEKNAGLASKIEKINDATKRNPIKIKYCTNSVIFNRKIAYILH